MAPETSPIEQIAAILHSASSVVLTTHVNPDGDGLGCEVALGEWLRRRGNTVEIINHSEVPYFYQFLDPEGSIKRFNPDRDSAIIASASVIVLLDMNQPERLRSMEEAVQRSASVKICIDHHLDPHPFADHYLIDAEATSTGEILYTLLQHLGGVLTPSIAGSLYTAIMTDTGSFRYPRVDAETHRIVARLIEHGADPVALYSNVYERWTPGRIRLLGETLAGMEIAGGGHLIHVSITQDMLRRTGTTEVDTDNFTTYPMSVDGAKVGILFLELRDGVKISFRSKGDIPINDLAREFGGNGHKNAAGARVFQMPLQDVRHRVLSAAEKYLSTDNPTQI